MITEKLFSLDLCCQQLITLQQHFCFWWKLRPVITSLRARFSGNGGKWPSQDAFRRHWVTMVLGKVFWNKAIEKPFWSRGRAKQVKKWVPLSQSFMLQFLELLIWLINSLNAMGGVLGLSNIAHLICLIYYGKVSLSLCVCECNKKFEFLTHRFG